MAETAFRQALRSRPDDALIHYKLGNALLQHRGQALHVAGSLSIDRWQGNERVQLRVLDVAVPDQGPAVIR